jgi:hypothetical protein
MDTGWNSFHENLLRKWAQTSKTFAIMHSLSAAFYAKWDRWLGIPVVLLGAVTASSIFATSQDTHIQVHYANGGLALLAAGLSGVARFLGYAEKQVKHQNASVKYTAISMEVDALLSFPREGRTAGPQEFINTTRGKILEIREGAPEVIAGVMTEYLKGYDRSLTRVKSRVNRRLRSQSPSGEPPSDGSEGSPDVGYSTASGPTAARQPSPPPSSDGPTAARQPSPPPSSDGLDNHPQIEEMAEALMLETDEDSDLCSGEDQV